MLWRILILFHLVVWTACGDAGAPVELDSSVTGDADGDTIRDDHEGAATRLDTDGDGTPDYLDTDSDQDSIPDRVEAGDDKLDTVPLDSDSDGIPDARDTDSDKNGFRDNQDGTGDLDGDRIPDFQDLDDDGDRVEDHIEIRNPSAPLDSDADGIPDYRDTDSDGDTILDFTEGNIDADRDGEPDRIETDSDGDGFSDADEAGDRDPLTPPVDTDGDGVADYRDADSDDDGLSDALEAEARLSPTKPDTDGDGVTDLIEVAAGTDGSDRNDNPQARGDFVFLVPFDEAPTPARDTLSFETSFRQVDLYFAFDTTGSMISEMNAMRNTLTGVPAIIDELLCERTSRVCDSPAACDPGQTCNSDGRCQEDPLVDDCIPDIWTGLGTFFELDTFVNALSLQPDPGATATAIPEMTGDGKYEAPFQIPACVADGSNCATPAPGPRCSTETGRIGCPGFRADAVRIYVQITDADNQCRPPMSDPDRCDAFTAEYAGALLKSRDIKFISLVGKDDNAPPATGEPDVTPQDVAEAIGRAADTLGADGNPLVFPAVNAEVVEKSTDAVRSFVDNEFEIRIFAENTVGNAARFIDYLEVKQAVGDADCPAFLSDGVTPIEARDTEPDILEPSGHPDTRPDYFPALDPGVPVCWDVVPLRNTTVQPTAEPQVFLARLAVRAAGSVVDSRDVYFLVPPEIPDPGGPI